MRSAIARLVALLTFVAPLAACDGHQILAPDASQTALAGTAGQKGPSNLSVTASPGQLGLSWQDNTPNESGFEVLRSTTGPLGTFSLLATTAANVTAYFDTGLDPARQYCYKVQAVAQKMVLSISNTVCATPLRLQPNAASNLDANLVSYSYGGGGMWQEGNYVWVNWTDNSSNEEGFRIALAPSPTGPWVVIGTVGAGVQRYRDFNPRGEQTCYEVIAFNTYGAAEPSNIDCTGIPFAPTDLVAVSVDGHTIDLTWTDHSAFEDGYEVWRCCEAGPEVRVNLPANATNYRDVGLTVNTRYAYHVRAKKDQGYSGWSYVTTVTADAPPPAPSDVQAVPVSSSAVALSWAATPGGDLFRVERSRDGGTSWEPGPIPGEADDGLTPDQVVCYRVFASNARGESGPSNPACTAPPLAPTDLVETAVDEQTVDLTWTDNSGVEDGYVVGYFYYSYDGFFTFFQEVARLPANATSYQIIGPVGESYVVAATRDGGRSDYATQDGAAAAAAAPRRP
jgi:Fibronectin type III domain